MRLTIDFETRSACDLKTAGPWKYAAHPTTEIICLAVKADKQPTLLWWAPWVLEKFGLQATLTEEALLGLLKNASEIEAHNAEFERAVWHHVMKPRYDYPELPLRKLSCTAARAAVHGLPRALSDAGHVLGLPTQKDPIGHSLMLKLCKPRRPRKGEDPKGIYWRESAEDYQRLGEYCVQDVDAEAQLSDVLRPLSAIERQVWLLDQKINARGITVDLANIRAILETLETYEAQLLGEMKQITGGAVTSPRQVQATREWLGARGVVLDDMQKATVVGALKYGMPPEARRVLEIRQALAKSSTSKFTAMALRADRDGRCRSLFMFHAAGTGRWSGKAIQPQNLPRDSYKDETLECAFELFRQHDADSLATLFDDPFFVASRCVRGSIVAAPGKDLICADYSSIEARANAWLAGQDDVLAAFRSGLDLYKVDAQGVFGGTYESITKDQRQVGKVSTLALGYGGGIGAYAAMAATYGVDLETLPALVLQRADDRERGQAERTAKSYLERSPESMSLAAAMACDIVKQKWRTSRPRIVALWRGLGEASTQAVREPGAVFSYGRISFRIWRDPRGNPYLACRLPSGRCLYYFRPEIRAVKAPWKDDDGNPVYKDTMVFWGVDGVTKQWVRQKGPGFLLCENVVQALCRDLLAEAMLRLEEAGYPVVMHVHDEVVSEVLEGFGRLEEFEAIMRQVPPWARGLPVGTEGWRGKRFKKG